MQCLDIDAPASVYLLGLKVENDEDDGCMGLDYTHHKVLFQGTVFVRCVCYLPENPPVVRTSERRAFWVWYLLKCPRSYIAMAVTLGIRI